jgi:hypothetical protein
LRAIDESLFVTGFSLISTKTIDEERAVVASQKTKNERKSRFHENVCDVCVVRERDRWLWLGWTKRIIIIIIMQWPPFCEFCAGCGAHGLISIYAK